jgi:hypothetical protein
VKGFPPLSGRSNHFGGREAGAMADVSDPPELSAPTKRKLALQWSALLDTHHFTGEHFRLHDEARARRDRQLDRRRRIAALPGNHGGSSIDESAVDQETVVDHGGIAPSVALAEARFKDLVAEYRPLWLSSRDVYDVFAAWLDTIKRQVSTELASVWKGGSELHDRWYQRACAPALDRSLAALVKEWTRRALADELKRSELNEKRDARIEMLLKEALLDDDPLYQVWRAEDLPSREAFEASHQAAVEKFVSSAKVGAVAEKRRAAAADAPFRPKSSGRPKGVCIIDGEKVADTRGKRSQEALADLIGRKFSVSSLKRIEHDLPVDKRTADKAIKYFAAKGIDVKKKSVQKVQ